MESPARNADYTSKHPMDGRQRDVGRVMREEVAEWVKPGRCSIEWG